MSLLKSRFIEMFGDVINNKKTWPTKRWSYVLNIVNGKNQKKVECENGIYPICGSGGKIGKTNEYLTKENSVIIGRKGNINNPILMKTKFWNVDTAFGLEPNNKDINVEYLYKFCELFDFQRLNKTVTIPSLTKSDLLKIEIPVPPMKLQEEYRNFLAQVDKSKFLLQQILEKFELLKKSRFIEMFGDVINNKKTWPTKRWSYVLNIVNGKNQKKVECENGIYPICGSGGKIGKTNEYLTKENSVIIGRKGNINNPILMKTKFWNVDTAFGLEPNNKDINVEYLYKFCELFDFQRLNKTVTIPSLTKSDLLKIEIPVPPMKLQEEYRNFLAQVDKSKLIIQKALEDLVGKV